MKTFQRSLIVFLAAFVLLALPFQTSKASAASSEDVLNTYYPIDINEHWAFDSLDNFVTADLLKGSLDSEGNTLIKPDLSISRAEFVSILVRALGLTTDQASKTFADVPAGKWYSEPVRIASSLGIVNGLTETKFGPDELIKRGEIATIIVRAFESSVKFEGEAKTFSDVPEYFATPFIAKASQAGIVRGATATTFKPYANATRAEAVVMIQRALDLQKGSLPEDAALTALIDEYEAKEAEVINAQEFAKLGEVLPKYMTGYALAETIFGYEDYADLAKEGYTLKLEKLTPQKYEIVSKTDRFAAIHATGSTYNVTVEGKDEKDTQTVPRDGVYLLKKMEDNSWKIYLFSSDEAEDASGEAATAAE
ncbi:S-layer homology domain-containing protein [Paenibacillus glycanilyticus]|uniref:S-layer homology domain-containing protein n=1 Tax=Paenibacillus glycanilyticus TaxID=126569 RepID=UPI00203FE075|nr:S-layer homology domain-containing protein [Paenibacillus glycanilyticus]MCM3627987.1 S-layer homology domain-containing protein [Paenibacillus glycanilyticus]